MSFRTTLQLHNSLVDSDRELFKPSKDSASFWAYNEKQFWGGSGFL